MSLRNLLSLKFTVFVLVAFLGFLGVLKYKQHVKQSAIEAEKKQLSEQARQLQSKNLDLDNSLAYLNSANYKERVARESLNLKREGEFVYNFSVKAENHPDSEYKGSSNGMSNASRWWNYFFHKN